MSTTGENPKSSPPLKPELLSPAGDWECLRAAVANGADAVYFGLPRFNARMRAENFGADDLPAVVEFLQAHGVKSYVALNVLIFSGELEEAVEELRLLSAAGVDAVIIQDVGLAELSRQMFPALRVHASTQMTVTSPEGLQFARELGVSQVVLSRELSLRELAKFEKDLPLEVFVHGALCVAYSGQCLTSESLGQRSANRGECAQACRMPYEMVVDGVTRELGDKRYLLSPQDLAAVAEIPELIRLGIRSFKIEGRLKTPEYVAAVTAVYRQAIDAAWEGKTIAAEQAEADRYKLEMTFSRGLFSGWMHGVDHQKLVGARYGKKRGTYLGTVTETGRDFVELEGKGVEPGSGAWPAVKAGDGVVFENPAATDAELGGRVYAVQGARLAFEWGRLASEKIKIGTAVWKTSDPALERDLRKSWQQRTGNDLSRKRPLHLEFRGVLGQALELTVEGLTLKSQSALQAAQKFSLDRAALEEVFSRLQETPYYCASLSCDWSAPLFLPRSELNRLKHEMVQALQEREVQKRAPSGLSLSEVRDALPVLRSSPGPAAPSRLSVLCRTSAQIEAALDSGVETIYADFEDIRRYRDAVAQTRNRAKIFLATPRIQKAGEQGFFKLIEKAEPDGVLIRNVGAISSFQDSPLRKIGDFSLNVANPVSAAVFLRKGLERVTISYDLNISQVLDLLRAGPAGSLEITLHQHMPMFHMEHCVFAAFLSDGSSFLDCGRPCETHRVHLRDRVGVEHPLRADVGCRNTLFNAAAQTGAAHTQELREAGLSHFRVELLEESAEEAKEILGAYLALLAGETDGKGLWRELKAQAQLGVTRGTLAVS